MKCPNCGAENPEGSMFCQECGTRLTTQGNTVPYNKTLLHVLIALFAIWAILCLFDVIGMWYFLEIPFYRKILLTIICIVLSCALTKLQKTEQDKVNKALIMTNIICSIVGGIISMNSINLRAPHELWWYYILPFSILLFAFITTLIVSIKTYK